MEKITSYIIEYTLSVFDQLTGIIPGVYFFIVLGFCYVILPIESKIKYINSVAAFAISIVIAGIALFFYSDTFLNREGIGSLLITSMIVVIVVNIWLRRKK